MGCLVLRGLGFCVIMVFVVFVDLLVVVYEAGGLFVDCYFVDLLISVLDLVVGLNVLCFDLLLICLSYLELPFLVWFGGICL